MFIRVDWFRLDVMSTFSSLRSFYEVTRRQLEEAKNLDRFNLESKFKPIVANNDEEAAEKFAEFRASLDAHLHYHDYVFPRTLHYSFLVHLFILLETHMEPLANEICARTNLNVKWKTPQHGFIDGTEKYVNVLATQLPKDGAGKLSTIDWNRMRDPSRVRNCVVHCNGVVERVKQDDAKARLMDLSKEPGTGVSMSSDGGYLILDAEYVQRSLGAAEALYDAIFDATGFGSAEVTFEP